MTKEEYEKKFADNQKFSGRGVETTIHMPCPFCAEPDFMIYRVIEVNDFLAHEAVCKHCGRGMKGIVEKGESGVNVEFVQTCGDPAPDFLPPIRRL